MSAIGDRGKATEKAVQKVLDAFNSQYADVTYHRYPDARAARGALAAQPSDYLVAARGTAYHLEAKELEHDYRLPKDKLAQLPKLKKFKLAGMDFAVITYHTEIKKWRCIPSTFFVGDVPPSWDLREFPTYASAELALLATGWFSSTNVQQ